MKRALLALVLLSGATCGGGDASPVELCKQAIETYCGKIFSCLTKEQLEAAKASIGLNATDCQIKLGIDCTPDKTKCDLGQTYHPAMAQACADGYKGLSCTDIMKKDVPEPAACAQVCTK